MKVEERLRDSLHRRAASVEPSPGGWTAVVRGIDRRQRRAHTVRVSLVAGMSVAALVLAVAVITVSTPTPDQNVAATGGTNPDSGPTTTDVPAAPRISAPLAIGSDEVSPDPTRPDPVRPADSPAPGPQMSPAMASSAKAWPLWPETQAELDRLQAGVPDQPWWNDASVVPSAYLRDRGLASPVSGVPTLGDGDARITRYTASGVSGWVFLSRYGNIFYVLGSKSDRILQTHIARQGDSLAVEVMAATPGTVVVRTKARGSDWNGSASKPVGANRPVTLTVDGPASTDLIVQIRHEGADGKVGLSEYLLPATLTDIEYEGLHEGSTLAFGRVGPVNLGETLANAEYIAGIAMAYERGEHCTTMSPTDQPEGVALVSTGASAERVDVIIVSAPGVRTAEGIGVGDTVDEVRSVYPGIEERLAGGRGRLVHRAVDDPGLAGYEMLFEVVDDKVVAMWSGLEGLSMSDEICA